MTVTDAATSAPRGKPAEWNWLPPVPIASSPLFVWPFNPVMIFKWFAASWFAVSAQTVVLVLALSIITWLYLQPALERCVTFEVGWVAQMFARNLGLMVLYAGGLHLYFYTLGKQGVASKFDPRGMETDSRRFTFGNQVWDNIFWTCASGVTFWTAYEALFMWAFANDYIAILDWREDTVWFVLLFLLIPVWESSYFFFIHRLLHWKPLYDLAHAVHHRNSSTGPWSGISMHPLEHAIYLGSAMVFLVLPAHPVHVIYIFQWMTLAPAGSHSGYQHLLIGGKPRVRLGSFHHQLHHRFFECNYGTAEVHFDEWAGSFHDGTPEATRRLREKRRAAATG